MQTNSDEITEAISDRWVRAFWDAHKLGVPSRSLTWVAKKGFGGLEGEDYFCALEDTTRWLEELAEGLARFGKK